MVGGFFRDVQRVDFLGEAGVDGGAAEFPHGGEKPAVWGQRFAKDSEVADLAIVREIGIYGIEGRLHGGWFDRAGDESAEITSAVADDDDMLGAGKKLDDFVFDWLGRNFVARIQNDQILDAADDAPITVSV